MEVQAEQFRNRRLLRDSFDADHANKKKKKKKFGRFLKAAITGGASEVIRNRKKIGKGLKKVGKAIKKVTMVATAAPLIPFKGLMKKALKKKGVNPPKNFPDLIEVFYNNIVKKSSNFESHPFYGKTLERDGYNDDHIIGDIVKGVLQFIMGLIKKKKEQKAGAPVELSPIEDAIANEASSVVGKIDKKIDESGIDVGDLPGSSSKDNDGTDTERPSRKNGKGKKDNTKMYLLIGGGVAVVIGAVVLLRK